MCMHTFTCMCIGPGVQCKFSAYVEESTTAESIIIGASRSEPHIDHTYEKIAVLMYACYYWCWRLMLDDLIILVDSLSISLGMRLSITLKAGVRLPGRLWEAVAQSSEHLWLEQEVLGSIPGGCPGFFSSSWLTNVNGMKALVQLSCFQHKYEYITKS